MQRKACSSFAGQGLPQGSPISNAILCHLSQTHRATAGLM